MEVGAALVKAPAVELTLVRPRSGRKQSAQRRCAIERGGGYGESKGWSILKSDTSAGARARLPAVLAELCRARAESPSRAAPASAGVTQRPH